jgi:hypothetical protein
LVPPSCSVTVRHRGFDWTTAGAVAGPVLALASLAWQAVERLRRPVLDAHYRWEPYARLHPVAGEPDWGVMISAGVRVINPRPVPIIVERIEMQARTGRWPRGVRRTLSTMRTLEQIGPVGEDDFATAHDDVRAPVALRMRVKLRGRRRWLRTRWACQEPGYFEPGWTPGLGYGRYLRPAHEAFPPAAMLHTPKLALGEP